MMRTRLLFVLTLIAGSIMVLPAATASAQTAPTCGPYVTLTPSFGEAGTVVSVNLFHYPPNAEVTVTLRIPGDPVVATGTTDADGRANIIFTMQEFPGDRVAILAASTGCNWAGAYFEFREVTPTPPLPTPETPTPTQPPSVTPTTPAASPTVTTPAPTKTPQPPIAGTGGDTGFGSTGTNLALVGLALVIFCGAFALWGSTRHLRTAEVRSETRGRSRIWIDRSVRRHDDDDQ